MKRVYFGLITLFQTIVSLLLVMVYNHKGAAREVRRMKSDRKDRAATILASGPSAREIITSRKELLNGTDLLVLNYFGNTNCFRELKPTYYIMLDPVLFDDNYKSPGLNEDSGADVNNETHPNELLINSFRRVDWKMTLFVPSLYNKEAIVKMYGTNPFIRVVPFYATRVVGYRCFQNYLYSRAQGVPTSRNVIIPAILLMALLGYKRIFLYGCEFSWTKTMDIDPSNGQLFFNDHHSYGKDDIRYFGKGAYLWWLEAITEMLKGLERVSEFADKSGVRIINRTKGSFIDAFDYENPDTIEKRL